MMGKTFYFDWEMKLMESIQAHFNGFEIFLSKLFSLLGQEYALVLIVLILYFCVDKKIGKRIAIQLMTVLVWAPMVKNVFFRRRPYFDNEKIDILIPASPTEDPYDMVAQGFSLPSAHSACSAAAYPSLAHFLKKKAYMYAAVLLTFLIGVSRFCVGAHYPTDVLVGWFLGALVALVVPFLYSKIGNENIVDFILLATAIPGLFYCQTEDFFSGFALLLGSCFGFMFEEKYVNFEHAASWKERILRVVLGICVFLLFAQGIKFIFGEGLLVRVIRYSIASFITLAIYPMFFKYLKPKKKD